MIMMLQDGTKPLLIYFSETFIETHEINITVHYPQIIINPLYMYYFLKTAILFQIYDLHYLAFFLMRGNYVIAKCFPNVNI